MHVTMKNSNYSHDAKAGSVYRRLLTQGFICSLHADDDSQRLSSAFGRVGRPNQLAASLTAHGLSEGLSIQQPAIIGIIFKCKPCMGAKELSLSMTCQGLAVVPGQHWAADSLALNMSGGPGGHGSFGASLAALAGSLRQRRLSTRTRLSKLAA